MTDSVLIPSRFNGPIDSGQGGYSAGVAAQLVGGAAEVTLRRPVPLDTPLEAIRRDEGSLTLADTSETVIEVRSVQKIQVEVPDGVSAREAREAKARYAGSDSNVFSHCFVCGRARDDSFGVFAGRV